MRKYVVTVEGETKLLVPGLSLESPVPPQTPAFFNPRGRRTRDLAIIAYRAYLDTVGGGELGDPLSGVGAKSIRALVEVPRIAHAYINDLNPVSLRLARRSARLNSVAGRVTISRDSAWSFLERHARSGRRFAMVDIDPFGSPTEFIEPALRSLKDGGLLSVTATDTAPLSGLYREVGFRKYFGYSLRTDYSRELGLRLLCSMVIRRGLAQDCSLRPVFVQSDQHYMRAYFLFVRGAQEANSITRFFGYVSHCFVCGASSFGSDMEAKCSECGSKVRSSGLTWLGALFDGKFVREMVRCAQGGKLAGYTRFLGIASEELDSPPYYYRIPNLADTLGLPSVSPAAVVEKLVESGWHASLTSIDPQGVKSNAPLRDVKSVLARAQQTG